MPEIAHTGKRESFQFSLQAIKKVSQKSNNVPLYITSHPKPVAFFDRPTLTLRKGISFARHLVLKPVSIAFDGDIIRQALALGAIVVFVTDLDSGDRYTVLLDIFVKHSLPVNRRYGDQRALTLDYWQKNGEPSQREKRAKEEEERAAAQPVQLGLFGGAQ